MMLSVNNMILPYFIEQYDKTVKSKFDNAVVLFCWPEKAFKHPNALHAFLCTDIELNAQTILEYYSKRWPIEIFFRESKNNLGLKGYQVRSSLSIDRLLLLIVLAYMYCTIGITGRYQRFNTGLKQVRKSVQREMYEWIYHASKNGITIEDVFHRMKVS
jgi:IS4 transposase